MLKNWKTRVQLISHSILLRSDDVHLRGRPLSARFSKQCDLSAIDDVRHLALQCLRWLTERAEVFRDIVSIQEGCSQEIINASDDVVLTLMGKPVKGFSEDQMVKVWRQAAVHTQNMYYANAREGIG